MLPRIGPLRHRLQLQSFAQTPNAASGGLDDGYVTLATVWGLVEPIGTARYDGAQQVEAHLTHRVIARWRADHAAIRFIVHDGRRLAVRGVRGLDPAKRFIEFLTEETATGV